MNSKHTGRSRLTYTYSARMNLKHTGAPTSARMNSKHTCKSRLNIYLLCPYESKTYGRTYFSPYEFITYVQVPPRIYSARMNSKHTCKSRLNIYLLCPYEFKTYGRTYFSPYKFKTYVQVPPQHTLLYT
jgi:hypothetical protein